MDKPEAKITVEERDDCFVFFFHKKDQDWTRFNIERFLDRLQEHLIQKIAPSIQDKIFNDVMGKIDVQAIANRASVRIIQNMSQSPNQNRY